MRILVLGAEGMLGSALMRAFPAARGTVRDIFWFSDHHRTFPHVDITIYDDLREAFDWAQPEVMINCTGIVKSACTEHNVQIVDATNAHAPHAIARLAATQECRVIHISTDCVFSGAQGGRKEEDPTDATDLYGISKAAGELTGYAHCVTLRTSFIGRDRKNRRGLLEWLLAQSADTAVPGYANAMWSGLSTIELARVIGKVIETPSLSGLYHVAGPVISKAKLLQVLALAFDLPRRIRLESEPRIDRTLNASKFEAATGYTPPTWHDIAEELAVDG